MANLRFDVKRRILSEVAKSKDELAAIHNPVAG
jgi:hypothetical protein